ncbi:MAG: hypothetical protein HC893_00660 [Chloroflexaceae bacterium]|nr:hypothetical protein [Chloroflexaceae bacterium]NJL32628.1 hypothetical protein [Chloroflexaceae bacterium]NJO04378.1 hypothetical protein [Chloroflexaceae bacterium]
MTTGFFTYQQQVLDILKAWGLGSVGVGALCMLSQESVMRQFGWQALTWGGIDAALAQAGQVNAQKKAWQAAHGAMTVANEGQEIRNFHRILIINTVLDVGYILGGLWLVLSSAGRRERIGMGMGIVVQGSFLMVYDAVLAHDIARNWPVEVDAV